MFRRIKSALQTIARVYSMLHPQRWMAIRLAGLRILISLWDLLLYSVIIMAVGSVIKGGSSQTAGAGIFQDITGIIGLSKQDGPLIALLGALAAVIVRDILNMAALVMENRYVVTAVTGLRVRLLRNFYDANQTFLDENKSSDRDRILIGECRKTVMVMVFATQVLGHTANTIVVLAMLLGLSPQLTGALLVCLLPLLVFKYFYTAYLKKLAQISLDRRKELWLRVKDYNSGILQFKLAGRLSKVRAGFQNAAFLAEQIMQKAKLMRLWENPIIEVMGLLVVGALILISRTGWAGIAPANLASLIAFLVLLNRMVPIMSRLGVAVSAMMQNFPSAQYVSGFNPIPDEYREKDEGREKKPLLERSIEFQGVDLDYHSRAGVLHDINITISKGERIGIVGPSGAGKSSLAHMLLGLYEASHGNITIDGVDLSDISKKCLWEHIGLVSQHVHLFDLSIKEIISFAKENGGDETKIKEAAQKANAHGFIEAMPQKYDTVVGEQGVRLSGGERQRLLISQIMFKDPEIIIFDEATSALDSATEQEIINTIESLSGDKTLILIAHRLATLKNADRIYVLKDGRVSETGSWESLMDQQGLFWQMVQQQQLTRQIGGNGKQE